MVIICNNNLNNILKCKILKINPVFLNLKLKDIGLFNNNNNKRYKNNSLISSMIMKMNKIDDN